MPSKSLKVILFSSFFLVFFTALYLGYLYQREKRIKQNKPLPENTISLTGIVKKGKDIAPQSSYCPSQLYIVTDNQNYQLRTPDNVKVAATTEYAKYRGSKVKITANLQDSIPNCTNTIKDCSCDPFVLVENIERLESTDLSYPSFPGKISCLPGTEGTECTLVFESDDGKFYILKNIPDDKIFLDNKLTVIGELTPVANDKEGISGLIDVVEVK